MTKQTEAQRLADELDNPSDGLRWNDGDNLLSQAAAELRRLDEANKELLEALKNVTVHLIAAHSLLSRGGKKAAASDKIFGIMLEDYEKSFEVGRAAIAKHKGETK